MPDPIAITKDAIVEAFRATGLAPVRNRFVGDPGEPPCGCPLTALAMHRSGLDYDAIRATLGSTTNKMGTLSDLMGLASWLSGAVMVGWDNATPLDPVKYALPKYDEYFALRNAAALASLELKPASPPRRS